jgi:hypothetical protein
LEVGLDSGMMGRSTLEAIWRTICSVNAAGWVEVPISMVGSALATTSASPIPSPLRDQFATSPAGWAEGT